MTGVPGQALTLGGDGIQKLNLHTPMGPSTKKWNLEPTLPFLSYLRKNLDRRVPRRNLWTNSLGSRSCWSVDVQLQLKSLCCCSLQCVACSQSRVWPMDASPQCRTPLQHQSQRLWRESCTETFLVIPTAPCSTNWHSRPSFRPMTVGLLTRKRMTSLEQKDMLLALWQQIRYQFVRWHKTFVQNSGTGLGTPKSQRTRLLPNKNEFWECLRTSRTPMQNKLPILSGSWIPSKRHGTEQISWGSCRWISLMLLLDSESESFNQLFIFIFVSCFSKVERSSTKETQTLKKISTGPLVPVLLCEYEKNQSTCPIQKSFKRGKLELLGTC